MATGIPHFFDQSRLVSAVGGITGATVYFYLTGSTNLATIYTDLALTIPATNPVVISAGSIVPNIYLDPAVTYRRKIIFTDGSIFDVDPLAKSAATSSGGSTTAFALTMNNGGAGAASGSTFNGSTAVTISYNTIGAAPLASPTFTGIPAAPTAAANTNTTQIATCAFVTTAVSNAARPTVSTVSASFSAADADNNTHKTASGASQTITLGTLTAGTAFTIRFTTAWSVSCAGGLSKNGAAPTGITTGSIAANSLITFIHEGSGVWTAAGTGLT